MQYVARQATEKSANDPGDLNKFFSVVTEKEERKKVLLLHCSKIKSFWFCFRVAGTKTYFRNKIYHHFNEAHHAQHIFSNKMDYDDNFRRNLICF